MRDGDVMGLLQSLKNAQKYDCMIPNLLVIFKTNFCCRVL